MLPFRSIPKRRQSAQLIVDWIPLDSRRFSHSNASMIVPHFEGSLKLRGTQAAPVEPGAAPGMSDVRVIDAGSAVSPPLLTRVLLIRAIAAARSPAPLRRM